MSSFTQKFSLFVASGLFVAACSPGAQQTYSKTQNDSGIIAGEVVNPNSPLATSIVGIYDLQVGAICTGSLYDDHTILTAAHCIGPRPDKMFIIFATNMNDVLKSQDGNVIREHVRRVVSATVNPGWDARSNSKKPDTWNDIAVIKFAGPVPTGFKPATLLADTRDLSPNIAVTLAGYGVNQMKITEVDPKTFPDLTAAVAHGKVICNRDQTTCVSMESSGSGQLRSTQVSIAQLLSHEVVLDQTHGTGACSGDSGGPAYVLKDGRYYLWGVTSRGSVGCDTNGIYTNILTYKDWVDSVH